MRKKSAVLGAVIAVFCLIAALLCAIPSPDAIYVTLYLGGKQLHGFTIEDAAQKKIIRNAFGDAALRPTPQGDRDIGDAADRIEITLRRNIFSRYTEYRVFNRDGAHYLQQNGDSAYCELSDEAYAPLLDIAMGYFQPDTAVISAGGQTIHALGSVVWANDKKQNIAADMIPLEPQLIAEHVQCIELSPGAQADTPFVLLPDGRELSGSYTLYDEDFRETAIVPAAGADIQETLTRSSVPGTYLVRLDVTLEASDFQTGMQYFFGYVFRNN
jgi:hypothetical protein